MIMMNTMMMMKITMLLMAGMSGDSVSARLTLILLPHLVLKDKNIYI